MGGMGEGGSELWHRSMHFDAWTSPFVSFWLRLFGNSTKGKAVQSRSAS